MLVRLVCLLMVQVFGWLALLARSDDFQQAMVSMLERSQALAL
jgi:hypothetical protein